MSTILNSMDFTDTSLKNSVTLSGSDWSVPFDAGLPTSGFDNIYLTKADDFYESLLRKKGIATDSTDLADPVTFEVKEIMVLWTGIQIFNDLIDDSEAPFENSVVLEDKFEKKLRNYTKRYNEKLGVLDKNSFYDASVEQYSEISTDIMMIGNIGRS